MASILDDLLIEIQAPVQRPAPVARPGVERGRAQPQAVAPAPPAPSMPSIIDDLLPPRATAAPTAPVAAPTLSFDGTPDEVRSRIATLPPEQRKGALSAWADSVVAKERSNQGIGGTIDDYVRRGAEGIVGGWGDKLGAKLSSAIGGSDYDEALAYERARTNAARQATDQTKIINKVPLIGGEITTGDLAGVAGGIAGAAVMPIARMSQLAGPLKGAPSALPSKMIDYALTGAGYGGAIGYGTGDTETEQRSNAAKGAAWGAGIGAAAPAVGKAVGATAGAIGRRATPLPPQVAGYSRPAIDRVAQAFENDAPTTTGRFGAEGMLADMGENLRQTTGALAATPGPNMQTINAAVLSRRKGAPGRIAGDIDATLGQPENLVALEDKIMGQARAKAKPLYDEFYASDLKPSEDLQRLLGRAKAVGAWDKAVRLMEAEGIDANTPVSNARLIDLIKRGVDDVVREQTPGSNMYRITSDIAKSITREVDGILSPSDPAKSPWAQARKASGEGLQFREGLEEGQAIFKKSTHPDQMAADMKGMSGPYEAGFVSGGRGAIRDTMGNAGAAYGANGDIAALKLLNSEYAQQKFGQLVGDQGARRLSGRLNTEAEFNRTYDDVLRNSKTAVRQSVQEGLPNPNKPYEPMAISSVTTPGLIAEGVRKIAELAGGSVQREKNTKILKDMAEMLVAQGASRELVADGLRQYIVRTRVVGQARGQIDKVITHLLRGTGLTTATPSDRASGRATR